MPRRLTSAVANRRLKENPFIESTIYFFASTADAEGGHARFMRQMQNF
jgi:hypothetical protein